MSDASLFGFHPVREALRHRPHRIERVLIARERRGKRRGEIVELCRRHQVETSVAGQDAFRSLGGEVHNGFIAVLREVDGDEPGSLRHADPELILLVEDVSDPRNLGALLRVCESAGVGQVLIRDRGSAPLSPVVAKTSAGAMEWLDIERIPNTGAALSRLKQDKFWVYGAAAGGRPPWEIDLRGPVVLCIGGEQNGLRQRTRKLCDELVGLPMKGRVGSLNLATAAAALVYEAVRQRTPLSAKGDSG